MTEVIRVAVGVIRNAKGEILLAKRSDDAHQGGLWEFPGGKIEAEETRFQALKRELWEELAIDVFEAQPLIQVPHTYGDRQVLLDVWEVDAFHGNPQGNEGQPLAWVNPNQLDAGEFPLPAANLPICKAIQLPHTMLITGPASTAQSFLNRLDVALDRGVSLVQFRVEEPLAQQLGAEGVEQLAETVYTRVRNCGARMLINTKLPIAGMVGDGLHLPSQALMSLQERPSGLVGASCHNAEEIARAERWEVDYVLLSPVQMTLSHPGAKVLGWEGFAELVANAKVPVFALGGLTPRDITTARRAGGQGIAAISSLWFDGSSN